MSFFIIVSSIIIYIVDFSIYLSAIWFTVFTMSLIQYNLSNRDVEYCYTENPNSFGIVRNITCILLGIFILSIPHTKIFFMIGGGGNPKVDYISKILLSIYGILLILLDNHSVLLYNKFIRKSNTSKF